MIALKTSLNGHQICIAGAADLCVLNSIVNAVGKLGEISSPRQDSDVPPAIFLSVGGLTGRANSDDEHLRWTEDLPLSVGDEVVITILEVAEADTPVSRISAKSTLEEYDKQRYESALNTLVELEEKYGSEYWKILEAK